MRIQWKLPIRPRRNRSSETLRSMVRETDLEVGRLLWPLFVIEGKGESQPIASLPGVNRWSVDQLVKQAKRAHELGIPGVALFPALDESKKDSRATESTNKDGLLPRAIRALKEAVPDLLVFTDVAMDPYSSDGHDGLVEDGKIVNDPSLEILGKMALVQCEAGADFVAPSDMMDGRVGYLRKVMDETGFEGVGILAYTAKYASGFYGPFRDALESAPRFGDKKTYQMDPANAREAMRELSLDVQEGADMVMVKPALPYLDIVRRFRERSPVPIAAYQVSGEYAMIAAAAEKGWLDRKTVRDESLLAIRRAGADVILTYFAMEFAAEQAEK